MIDAQKPDHISLTNMISRLREGRYEIPDFQREFEWDPSDINSLMRSIFLDYYIGSLLLWKGKTENFDQLACEPIYGFSGTSDRTHIVLDGQQRLSAMHYAFVAPDVRAPRRHNRYLYFIQVDRFMEEDFDSAFLYYWTSYGQTLLDDRERQFERHMFPLAVIGAGGWELGNWAQGYQSYWEEAAENSDEHNLEAALRHSAHARGFGKYLREVTEKYQISYIELDQDLHLEKICDIFTQINSRGIRLDVFDLMNALLRPKGVQLRHLWREAEQRLEFVITERMNVYVLQVMSLLRQAYCSPKYLYYLLPGNPRTVRGSDGVLRSEVLVSDTGEFVDRWNSATNALEHALELLRHPQEFGAISSEYLPYVSILPAFAALQTEAQKLPAHQRLAGQRKIRYWYWASVFMNRYSGAVESTSARDYIDVKDWFIEDAAEPELVREFRESFERIDFSSETRRGTSIYNGIFNLLVLGGARDWVSGTSPRHDDLDDHHIVPKSWGSEQVLHTPIDTILNRTPLTEETNRGVIRDRLPNAYLRELIASNGEEKVLEVLESHFVSGCAVEILMRNPFTADDFEAFLDERRRCFIAGIEDLLVKERLDLPPQIRELDSRLEAIELDLRRTISEGLGGDVHRLPIHVRQKIDDRLHVAGKKNPTLDLSSLRTMPRMLEYADLRELEDTIKNKAVWASFETTFRSKEQLGIRFQQFAELRNSIRHSRTVGEITRKDGEASILWFEQVLSLQ